MKITRPVTETVKATKNNVIVRFSTDSLKRIHDYDLQRSRDEISAFERVNQTNNPVVSR